MRLCILRVPFHEGYPLRRAPADRSLLAVEHEEVGMYAVIKTGGKQYRVAPGQNLRVEKLPGNPGDKVAFDEVLLVGGDKVKIGQPIVAGAKVEATIVAQDRAKKVIVFKFKRRKNFRRKKGHRQLFTELRIEAVNA